MLHAACIIMRKNTYFYKTEINIKLDQYFAKAFLAKSLPYTSGLSESDEQVNIFIDKT